jgi:maleylpyruvate isomerase
MSFKLHSGFRSSASWRVRIALAIKDIKYTYVPVNLTILTGNNTAKLGTEVTDKNSMAQVPILEFQRGNETIYLAQSIAILEYLEDVFPFGFHGNNPSASILPKLDNPILRARVRQCAEIVNSGIHPLQNVAVLRQVKQVELTGTSTLVDSQVYARHTIITGLNALEKIAAKYDNGGFMCGSPIPTVADICLIPQLHNAFGRFEVNMSDYPTLVAIQNRCSALPAFQAARPGVQHPSH